MKSKYDWGNSPEWAMFAARDSNGFAYWYSTLPHPSFESGYGVEWKKDYSTLSEGSCDPFWNQENDCSAICSLEARAGLDPYEKYLGKDLIVERRDGTFLVSIFRNKIDNTYSYINKTKKHICTCKFESIALALQDLHEQSITNKINTATFS